MKITAITGNGLPVGTAMEGGDPIYRDGKPFVVPILTKPNTKDEPFMTTRQIFVKGLEKENGYLEKSGIILHGINKEGDLGTPASHGCIRFPNSTVVQLADKYLTEGSKVYLVP